MPSDERGVLAQVGDQLRAGIRGEQNQRVLEVDHATLAVLHPPLVEHLEEDLVHVRVGLFHLVQEHHAVGTTAHRFGEHATLAVAHVAGGRTRTSAPGSGRPARAGPWCARATQVPCAEHPANPAPLPERGYPPSAARTCLGPSVPVPRTRGHIPGLARTAHPVTLLRVNCRCR